MKKSLLVLMLALASPSAFAAGETLRCWGTEPFWNLTIQSNGMRMESPEYNANLRAASAQTPSGRLPGGVMVYQTKPTSGYKITPVTVVVSKGACTDGMSDVVAPYSVVYIQGSEVLDGCCM